MIVYNTRFCPTVNGPLHLGHLYLVLVNEHEAHASGGKFVVRFDDNQRAWEAQIGLAAIERYRQQMIDDLGGYVMVDQWTSQAGQEYNNPTAYLPKPFAMPRHDLPLAYPPPVDGHINLCPEYVADRTQPLYPCIPAFTAEHAIMDYNEHINWLIRGMDLITEFAFYEYVREMFGFPPVRHAYLPRLKAQTGGEVSPVSKTLGRPEYTIAGATRIYGKEGVMRLLSQSCLIDPYGEWSVRNIRPDPRLQDD